MANGLDGVVNRVIAIVVVGGGAILVAICVDIEESRVVCEGVVGGVDRAIIGGRAGRVSIGVA